MNRSTPAAFALGLLLAVTATAHAQKSASNLVDAGQPGRINDIAKGFGSSELTTDKGGDPLIRGRMGGKSYVVNFYGCKEGKACRTIQFRAWFELSEKPTLEDLHNYNRDYRFLKVFLDKDEDLVVEHDVNLDGGVSQKNLDDTFDWWKLTLGNIPKRFKVK